MNNVTRIRVYVTPRDIREGSHHGYSCPVSRAIARKLLPAANVQVGYYRITANTSKGHEASFLTPPTVREFLGLFDGLEPVERFNFRMTVPNFLVRK